MRTVPLAIVALGIVLATLKLHAQGTVWLNNYDSSMGVYLYTADPPVRHSAPFGTFVEILGGASADSMVPLHNLLGGGPVFTTAVPNTSHTTGALFDAGFGAVPGVPANGTGWFQVLAWFGAPTYQAAPLRGQSQVWSQAVGAADPQFPPGPPSLNIPAPIVLVPEPGTIVLTTLGLGALLAARRRG